MYLTASAVLSCGFTWTCVLTTSAGWVIREANTPARTPQPKLATGAEADVLISSRKTDNRNLIQMDFNTITCLVLLLWMERELVAFHVLQLWWMYYWMTSSCTLTFRQQGLGLAVEHDVDPREWNISEESGHQAREQSCRTLSPTHTAQSPNHTPIVVPATLKHKHTHTV